MTESKKDAAPSNDPAPRDVQEAHEAYLEAAKTKLVDDGLAEEPPVLGPPGTNDNGGNDAVLTAK